MAKDLTSEQMSWIRNHLISKVKSGELTTESALEIERYYQYNRNDEYFENVVEESSRRITPPTEADIAEDRRKDAEKHKDDDEAAAKRRKQIAKAALIGTGVAAAGGLAYLKHTRDKYYIKATKFNNHLNKLADSAERSLDIAKAKYDKGEISKAKYDNVKKSYDKLVNSLTDNSEEAANYAANVKEMNPKLNELYRSTMNLRAMTKNESKPAQAVHNLAHDTIKGVSSIKNKADKIVKRSEDDLSAAKEKLAGRIKSSKSGKNKGYKKFV